MILGTPIKGPCYTQVKYPNMEVILGPKYYTDYTCLQWLVGHVTIILGTWTLGVNLGNFPPIYEAQGLL